MSPWPLDAIVHHIRKGHSLAGCRIADFTAVLQALQTVSPPGEVWRVRGAVVDQFAAVDLVIAGVLYFTDCNFTTGLTLSGCKFEKPIEMEHKAIVMEDCVFEGAVSFVQLSCKRDLWIIDCSFLAEVGFQAVKLSAPVIIF